MSAEREKELFLEGLAIKSPTDRAAFLDQACGSDVALRHRVDALFQAQRENRSFLEHPAVENAETALLSDTTDDPDAADSRTTPHVDDIPLDFLEPPHQPGSLGRLDQYDILEAVGRGGMGIVLKAHDARLKRVVAVKVLAPELASNATARKRFSREAQAAAAVSHDHVVTIYAVEDGGERERNPVFSKNRVSETLPYLVMEFIDGESLQEKIDREGQLELKEVLRIGRQVAAGLAAAHEQGLIHRDVKPSNILLQNGVQRVQITDFGLARAVDDVGMTKTGEITGTPQYMSPEQAQGQPVDARSDLFSLGSVLYAMCTGRSPFRADTSVASLRRVCDDAPRPIREINPDVPEWLIEIIDRLLKKNADDRFQTAEEVADLLGRHLAHLQDPGSTPFPGAVRPLRAHDARSTGKRQRWLVAGLVLLALTAAFGVTEATNLTHVAEYFSTVLRIRTPHGTLVLEIEDPSVQVAVAGNGEELTISGAGIENLQLRPGQYQVLTTRDGRPVDQELVTITRGDRQVLRVSVESDAQPATPRRDEREYGQWVTFFNGEDLTGWMTHPDFPGHWTVVDGALIGRGDRGTSLLFSERDDFESFHLRVEMRINEGSRSGIFFRSSYDDSSAADDPIPERFAQFDITRIPSQSRWCTYNRRTRDGRTRYHIPRGAPALGTPPNDWFVLEVIADGPHVVITSNGQVVLDFADTVYPYARGHIALQTQNSDTVVEFRKIEIRELGSIPDVATTDDQPFSSDILFSDDWTWTEPVNLGPNVNSEAEDGDPFLSRDGLTLVFASARPGGSGSLDLWMSQRSVVDAEWSPAVNLGLQVNSSQGDNFPSLAADGLTLLFSSDRTDGAGHWDLWMSTRETLDATWSAAVNLGPTINSHWLEAGPSLSSDGLVLMFYSTRPGGEGGYDLWLSRRASLDAEWSQPVPLGAQINSEEGESSPFLSADGRSLMFTSDRPGSFGAVDLWISRGASRFGPWSEPVNLGPRVNGSGNDGCATLSADGQMLIYESGRAGNLGAHDLWMTRRVPRIDHVSRAVELADQGRLDEAAQEFSLALSLVPDGDGSRFAILDQIWPDENLYQRVMDLRPDDINLWRDRGWFLGSDGRWEEAIACYRQRLEFGPVGAGVWGAYGMALLADNDFDGYREACAEILEHFSQITHPGELSGAAWTLAAIPDAVEDSRRAFALAERAYLTDPENIASRRIYARWLYRTDRLEEAIEVIDELPPSALEPESSDSDVVYFAAMAHSRLGETEKARTWAELASQRTANAHAGLFPWPHAVLAERLHAEMNQVLASAESTSDTPEQDAEPELPPAPPSAQRTSES